MSRSLILLIVFPLLAQHGRYLSESKNSAIGDPRAIASGSKLYTTSCGGCHGPDGSGGRGPNLVRRALWHPLSDDAIFRAIREGVPGADMPPTKLPDDQTWQLVAFIHAMTGPAVENLPPGDATAGEQIFWGAKANCSNCHSIQGRGGRMAPDLTNIGGSRPAAVIREAIVEPSKDLFLVGKEGVIIALNSGQTIQGIARNRNNFSLQVVDQNGTLHLIPMSDVKELTVMEKSPMPGDYAKRLTKQEMQDLIAYLSRQSVRAPARGTN